MGIELAWGCWCWTLTETSAELSPGWEHQSHSSIVPLLFPFFFFFFSESSICVHRSQGLIFAVLCKNQDRQGVSWVAFVAFGVRGSNSMLNENVFK